MRRLDQSAQELTPELLLRAYSAGIFPMSESRDDANVFWVDPQVRGVLPMDAFHIPRRLKKTVRSENFEVRTDTAFIDVLDYCAESPWPAFAGSSRAGGGANAPWHRHGCRWGRYGKLASLRFGEHVMV